MSELVYHITGRDKWQAGKRTGEYRADSLEQSGFIHCSKSEQILRVANTFYNNTSGLVILAIDPNQLKVELRWEPGTDKPDELFPHIYGPIDVTSVVKVYAFETGKDGRFLLPEGLT